MRKQRKKWPTDTKRQIVLAVLGGQLLALESVHPPDALLASGTDLLDPLFDHVVRCHPKRPELELLRHAGFRVEHQERRLGGIPTALRATSERDGSA